MGVTPLATSGGATFHPDAVYRVDIDTSDPSGARRSAARTPPGPTPGREATGHAGRTWCMAGPPLRPAAAPRRPAVSVLQAHMPVHQRDGGP